MNGYLQYTGQKDEDGIKDSDIDKTGRKHSNWLTMMYPRLHTARKLLSDDGVIFISCDDNEQANLKLLCDDVFGEENFFADLVVIRSEGGGLAKRVIKGHDNLLIYSKSLFTFGGLHKPRDIRGEIIIEKNKKYWIEVDWLREEFGKYGTLMYEDIESVKGIEKKKEIDEGIEKGIYRLIKKGDKHTVGRVREIEKDSSKFYSVLKHLNKNGIASLKEIKMEKYFDYPKPISLIKELALGATFFSKNNNDIILDFFAGSCTTAHAVMDLNKEDGGNRKYIMVQLPEFCGEKTEAFKAGYKNIAEIGKARIRRVAEKIKREKPDYKGDLGFKVFKLDESCIKEWKPNKDDLQQSFIEYENRIKPETTEQELMYEIMLNRGIPLACSIEKRSMGNNSIYNIHKGFMFMCLDEKILRNEVGTISSNIINWIKEIKGYDFQHADNIIVFRDSAFENDETKINMTETLKQSNINSVYSV